MRILLASSLCIFLANPVIAQAETAMEASASALAALMTGVHQTSDDDPNNDFVDTRVALSPLGPGHWVYYQLNTGTDRSVYRQRVLQLVDKPGGGVVQSNWSLKEPATFVDDQFQPLQLGEIRIEDLEPALSEGCDQHWRYDSQIEGGPWVGLVDPQTCKIFSEQRKAEIAIKAEARLSPVTLYQTEKGFDLNGDQLFGDPEGEFIILYRQK